MKKYENDPTILRKRSSFEDPKVFSLKCFTVEDVKREINNIYCVKNVQIQRFFWSVFSCIRTQYGDVLRRYIQSEYRKIKTIKILVSGHFSHNDKQ